MYKAGAPTAQDTCYSTKAGGVGVIDLAASPKDRISKMIISDEEREANYFAISLLMPKQLVHNWVEAHGPLDFCDDGALKQMAKDFGVSLVVAAVRLSGLGYFRV